MAKQQKTDLDRYIEAAADLRDVIVTAHQLLGDLREEQKRLRTLRDQWVNEIGLQKQLDDAVRIGLTGFNESLTKAIDKSTQTVYDRFDEIMLICLGEDPQSVREGKHTVIELVKDFVYQRKLPIKITEYVHLLMSKASHHAELSGEFGATMKGFHERIGKKLPIMFDPRIPYGTAFLVLPAVGDDPPSVVELNLRTGENAQRAIKELRRVIDARTESVPPGFSGKAKAPEKSA